MKKTTKIIISLALAIVLVAGVLTVSLFTQLSDDEKSSTTGGYVLQPTTKPTTTTPETESWVDLEQMASDLATATDLSTTTTTVEPLTTIIYVYTSIVDDTNNWGNFGEDSSTTTENNQNSEAMAYKYTVNPGTKTITITKYLGESSMVTIPRSIGGYTVTAIGDKCFAENKRITAVYIHDKITTIGTAAFQNCTSLVMLQFDGAFDRITVGNNAFQDCTKLQSINLPAAQNIGQFAFDGCSSLEYLEIKSGTERIENYCFTDCTGLLNIKIPESVTYIGQGAFANHNENLLMKCYSGSAAEEAAQRFGIKYQLVDG